MSISELRCFHAVASTGSFSKAAKLLLRAQSTVSIQVTQLEKSYEIELFKRQRGKKVQITELGEKLYEITQHLFALEVDTIELLKNSNDLRTGYLKIGASSPNIAAQYILPFRNKYPEVEVSLTLGNSKSILKDLKNCQIDIGFLGSDGDHTDCNIKYLAQTEIVLIAQKNYKSKKHGFINLKDITNETILLREKGSQTRSLFLSLLAKHNIKPNEIIIIGSREGVRVAASSGLGLAVIVLDEIQDTNDIKILRIEEFKILGQTYALSLKKRSYTKVIQSFLEIIDEYS